MQKWVTEKDGNSIVISKASKTPYKIKDKKTLYEDRSLSFSIEYNNYGKLCKYNLNYATPLKLNCDMDNCYLLIYTPPESFQEPEFEVAYEDSNVRILIYSHDENNKDYLIIGRWR